MEILQESLNKIQRRTQIINRVFNERDKPKWNQLRFVFTYFQKPHRIKKNIMWWVFEEKNFISERGFRKIIKELIDLEIIIVEDGLGELNSIMINEMLQRIKSGFL